MPTTRRLTTTISIALAGGLVFSACGDDTEALLTEVNRQAREYGLAVCGSGD